MRIRALPATVALCGTIVSPPPIVLFSTLGFSPSYNCTTHVVFEVIPGMAACCTTTREAPIQAFAVSSLSVER